MSKLLKMYLIYNYEYVCEIGRSGVDKVTCMEMLRAKLNDIPVIRSLLGKGKQVACLVCAAVERKNITPFIRCSTPRCIGVYCESCFRELQNKCTICLDPISYGKYIFIDV